MMTYEELKKELAINLYDLPHCCEKQAVLFLEASEEASKAKTALKVAKLNLEKKIAETDLWIRQNKTDIKLTESAISALINSDDVISKMKTDIVRYESEVLKWDSLVEAYNQRRSMLSNEVSLYTYKYFNSNDISEMDAFEKAIIEKRRNNAQKEAGSRK